MSQIDFLINIKTKGAEFLTRNKQELDKTATEVKKLANEQNKLSATNTKVASDLSKTNRALSNMKEATTTAAASFKAMGVGLLGGATAAILSVGALTAKVGALSENFRNLDAWSKKLALPIEEIQAMEIVARKTGQEFEQMADNIYDAAIKIEESILRKSGPAFEALGELGLKSEDFEGLSSLERVVKFEQELARLPKGQRMFYLDELSLKDSQIAISNLRDTKTIIDKLRENGTIITPVDQARMNKFFLDSKENAIQLDNAFQKMVTNTLPNVSILLRQIRGDSENLIDKGTIDDTSTALNVLLALFNSVLAVLKIVSSAFKQAFDLILDYVSLSINGIMDVFGSMYDTIANTFDKLKLLYYENKQSQNETFSIFKSKEDIDADAAYYKGKIDDINKSMTERNGTNLNLFDKLGISYNNFNNQVKGEGQDFANTWVGAGNAVLEAWQAVINPQAAAEAEAQRLKEQKVLEENNKLLAEREAKSKEIAKIDDKDTAARIAALKTLRDIQEAGGQGGITNFSYTKQASKIYAEIEVAPGATTEQKNNAKLARLQLEKELKLKIEAGVDITDIEKNLKEIDLSKYADKLTDKVYDKKKIEEYQKIVDRQGASELQVLTAKAEIQKIIQGQQKGLFEEVDRIEKTYKAGKITDEERVAQLREQLKVISATAEKAEDRLEADVRLNELNDSAFKKADLIRKEEAAGVKTKAESIRLQKIEYENIIKTSTKQDDILEARTRLLDLQQGEFEVIDMIDKKYQAYGTSREQRDADIIDALNNIINTSKNENTVLEARIRLRQMETDALNKQKELTNDLQSANAKLLKLQNEPLKAFDIEAKQRLDAIEIKFKGTKDYIERLEIEKSIINAERIEVELKKVKDAVDKAKTSFGDTGFFNFDESVAQAEKLKSLKEEQIALEKKHGKAIQDTGALSLFTNAKIAEIMGKSLDIIAGSLSNILFQTEDVGKLVKQMLADILTEINKVILRQIAMNVASSFTNSSVGGGFGSVFSGLVAAMGRNHTGGVIGKDAFSGSFGLRSNETIRVVEQNEGVFTAEQMRALGNRNQGTVAVMDTEKSAQALFRSSSMQKNLGNWKNDQDF